MIGKATPGRQRIELSHDIMGGRDYGHLKDPVSPNVPPTHRPAGSATGIKGCS